MPLTKVASSMLASGASGSGGSAGKNYISSYNNNPCNGDFESGSINGWVSCQVSSITNGLPSGLTLNAGTVTRTLAPAAIAGQYSLQTVFPATADQGFITEEFTIDTQDQAKVLTFTFYYQVTAGASNGNFSGTSANTFIVGIYAVNGLNAGWLQPAGVYSMTQSSGAGIATGTFQTYSDTTQYRFAILCENAPLNPITITFDDFSVGPTVVVNGTPVTDWQTYSLSITASTTNPILPSSGLTVNQARYRRIGDSIQIQYQFETGTVSGGNNGSGTYFFSMPPGLTIDSSKVSVGTVYGVVLGTARANDRDGVVTYTPGQTNRFSVLVEAGGTSLASIDSSGLYMTSNNQGISFVAQFPVVGFSSNVQISSDTDTRVVVMGAYGATTTVNNSGVTVIYPTVRMDSHKGYNASTGVYTVPVSGYYRVSGGFTTSPAAWVNNNAIQMSASITGTGAPGGTFAFTRIISAGTTEQGISGSATYYCAAGDTIVLRVLSGQTVSLNGGTNNFVSIERLSGPSVVAASETVAASYSASTSASSSTSQAINFDLKEYDTHNAVTPGVNWRYTAPVSGTYLVSIYVNATAGTASYFNIYKNSTSTIYKSIGYANTTTVGSGATSLKLNAGDYIGIYTSASFPYFGNASLNTQNTSHITIIRTGN